MCPDNFKIVQHDFCGNFCPCDMLHRVQIVKLRRMSQGQNAVGMRCPFLGKVVQHVPATEKSKSPFFFVCLADKIEVLGVTEANIILQFVEISKHPAHLSGSSK